MIKKNIVWVIILISLSLIIAIRWMGVSGENYRSIITSDGRGYYQYFVSLLGDNPISEQVSNGTYLVETPEGEVVNKYYVGLPILWTPFVMPVYVYHKIFDDAAIDLYSEGFQKAISLAALFYLLLGLFALKKLLESFDIERKVVGFSLFAFFFGTNLSYYAIIAPSMSHVYSFALISGFLYYIRIYSKNQLAQHLIYSTIIFGLIILMRPLNAMIVLAIPLVWKNDVDFLKIIKSQTELIVVAVFIFSMIIAIQPIFWYLQTGSLIQWSYAGEGFYFIHPQMLNFILSFRKGFMIYTPILGLSIISLIFIFTRNRKRALYALGFILLLIYLLSSWWNWYYGDSYGSRALIDYYPVFVLLFAQGLQYINKNSRLWIVSLSLFLVAFNIFQSYQYYHNIMSHFDMNKEKYLNILFKAGEEYENQLGGNDDIAPYHRGPMTKVYDQRGYGSFDSTYHAFFGQDGNVIINDESVDCIIVNKSPYVGSIMIDADKLLKYRVLYAELQCSTYSEEEQLSDVFWTVSVNNASDKLHYYAFRINGIPITKAKWRTDKYRFPIPAPNNLETKIQISIWNKGLRSFYLKDISLKLYGISDN
jgi:hypothetical protein